MTKTHTDLHTVTVSVCRDKKQHFVCLHPETQANTAGVSSSLIWTVHCPRYSESDLRPELSSEWLMKVYKEIQTDLFKLKEAKL